MLECHFIQAILHILFIFFIEWVIFLAFRGVVWRPLALYPCLSSSSLTCYFASFEERLKSSGSVMLIIYLHASVFRLPLRQLLLSAKFNPDTHRDFYVCRNIASCVLRHSKLSSCPKTNFKILSEVRILDDKPDFSRRYSGFNL